MNLRSPGQLYRGSPARLSGLDAYARLAGLGQGFLDYLQVTGDVAPPPDQVSGPGSGYVPPSDATTTMPVDTTPPVSATGAFDWTAVLNAGKSLLVGVTQADMQKQIFDLNVERAKRGLPPIASQTLAPTVGVQVGMSPDTKKMLTWAIGGSVLGYLVMKMLKRAGV
jgi:hypothetical protein